MAKKRKIISALSALCVLMGIITADLIVQAGQVTRDSFKVTVNYNLSLADMIAAGKYAWTNGDINSSNFPIEGKGQVDLDIELIHFKKSIVSDEVLRELDTRGLRPATLPELLAFGAAYPGKQREFPIIALGSVWQDRYGDRRMAYLIGYGSGRSLFLGWLGDRWLDYCRFAAVRESA